MPYVFYDEVPEGMEPVDVVERSEHDSILESLRNAESMRDAAIERAESLEHDLKEQKKKYAETFLSTPKPSIDPIHKEPVHNPQTFSELFKL